MGQYLWDFSFDELMYLEDGGETLRSANFSELKLIDELRLYFEKTAEQSRAQIQGITPAKFNSCLPSLIHADMVLQLCLIYSLGISELLIKKDQLIQTIEKESISFFKEYRSFVETYKFEDYSLMSQMMLV